MNIYVDIDDTICHYDNYDGPEVEVSSEKQTINTKYLQAEPIQKNIDKINKLYDEGNEITYYSARGSATGVDWFDITMRQLKRWGCKFHNVSVGRKPAYVLLICYKTKMIEEV